MVTLLQSHLLINVLRHISGSFRFHLFFRPGLAVYVLMSCNCRVTNSICRVPIERVPVAEKGKRWGKLIDFWPITFSPLAIDSDTALEMSRLMLGPRESEWGDSDEVQEPSEAPHLLSRVNKRKGTQFSVWNKNKNNFWVTLTQKWWVYI